MLPGCVAGQDEPRLALSLRGLRDTLPLHWDGSLGDPFGGSNGVVGAGGVVAASCTPADPDACVRQLVDASLSRVMCDQGDGCAGGGAFDPATRDHLASFLQSIAHAPARSRPGNDQISATAADGFRDFFTDRGGFGGDERATCADLGCHAPPLMAGTNSAELEGFDVPSLRGLGDRFVQFSLGITAAEEFLQATVSWSPTFQPLDERTTFFAAFSTLFVPVYGVGANAIFQMLEEAGTGVSGAFARQVTLDVATASGCPACEAETILADLETSDIRGLVNLRGAGLRNGSPVTVSFREGTGTYRVGNATLSRSELIAEAAAGNLLTTLTAHLRWSVDAETPQPLISVPGASCGTPGGIDPALPELTASSPARSTPTRSGFPTSSRRRTRTKEPRSWKSSRTASSTTTARSMRLPSARTHRRRKSSWSTASR